MITVTDGYWERTYWTNSEKDTKLITKLQLKTELIVTDRLISLGQIFADLQAKNLA